MPNNDLFVYLILSHHEKKATIGSTTDQTVVPPHHNGIVESKSESITVLHVPTKINDYTITALGYRALSGIPHLRLVYIPYTIQTFYGDALAYNYELEDIIFDENSRLTDLSFLPFSCCSKLRQIVLPKSVTNILQYAFANLTSITSIFIQNHLFGRDYLHIFDNTDTNKLNIYVPKNYPFETFAGIPVKAVLSPFYQMKPVTCIRKTISLYYSLLVCILNLST